MTAVNVLFSDGSAATIIGYFSSPQTEANYPNFGSVDSTDSRWKTYYEAQPDFIQVTLPPPA